MQLGIVSKQNRERSWQLGEGTGRTRGEASAPGLEIPGAVPSWEQSRVFLVGSAGPKQAVPGGRGVCPLHIAASGPSWWPQQEAWEGKSSKPERSTELCAPLDIYKLKSLLKSRCLSLGSSKHLALPMGCVLWGQGALGQPLRGPRRSRRLPQVHHSHTELNSAWRLPRGQKGAPKPAGLT